MQTNSQAINDKKVAVATHKIINSRVTAKIYAKGTLKIPSIVRNDMHLDDGTEVLFIKHGEEWSLTTREKLFKDGQAYFRSLNPEGKPIVDEFIVERHKLDN